MSSHKINHEKDIENKINFNRFNISLLYIFIINIINSLENLFLRRKEKVLFLLKETKEKDFPDFENAPSKVEKESIMILKIKKYNNINNQRIQNHIKKRKNNIQNANTIIRYYILINLIKFIKINIFCLIKSNIFYNL